ncbi:microtubule-associated protein RP/EB family member 1-like [Teleopsis dalmanni]|uniref:microtubule-associated protein RP/EB family member 1-like n=1 Tax=Teleopsis dalmanni TaxID=139649 RepID=UPI000D329DF1|nr:microtubule-associated protein RP/EB family member 1-like [Teleopsis dalmanni]
MPKHKKKSTETKSQKKQKLLKWVNLRLRTHFVKIDEMCSGAAYCQLFDIVFPSIIKLHKILFTTSYEKEYIKNFILLQNGFDQLHIKKIIPITKLVSGDPIENFEFLAWFKKLFDEHNDKGNELFYDAEKARDYAPICINSPGSNRIPPIYVRPNPNIFDTPKISITANTMNLEKSLEDIDNTEETNVENFVSKLVYINKRMKKMHNVYRSQKKTTDWLITKVKEIEEICAKSLSRTFKSPWLQSLDNILNAQTLHEIWMLNDEHTKKIRKEMDRDHT